MLCFCSRIADNLHEFLPNLESVILTGNNIQDFCDLDPLLSFPKLETLSLLANPVTTDPHYREYIAYKWVIYSNFVSSSNVFRSIHFVSFVCTRLADFQNFAFWISVKYGKRTGKQRSNSLEVNKEKIYSRKLRRRPKQLQQIQPLLNQTIQRVTFYPYHTFISSFEKRFQQIVL